MKKSIWLYLSLIVPLIGLALLVGILFFDYTIEKSSQQNFVNQVRDLEDEHLVSVNIITLHPLNPEQTKGEKKTLNPDEIARVQTFLQDIEIDEMTFFDYLGSRSYKRWFRGDTDALAPVDSSDAPTYSCLLTMKAEANKRFSLLGSVYGQNPEYQDALFLTNFEPGKGARDMFASAPKPVRIKNLGQWILEAISTSHATSPANDKPSPSLSPTTSTSPSANEQSSAGPIPGLQPVNLSENLLKNGDFNTLEEWERFHSSKAGDLISLEKGQNYIVWERTNSQNDKGKVGVYQNLDVDVFNTRSLSLCLDVWVDYHTLEHTGWWWEARDGNAEMPVEMTVLYLDKTGKSYQWNHKFLIQHNAPAVLWVNPDTGKWEYRSGVTPSQNVTPLPKASWGHFCFDLMDETSRKDGQGRRILPKPARLTRILLYGSGWDFRGAVGNVMLSGDRIPPAESAPGNSLTTGRRKLRPGSSSFTFTSYLMPNVPTSHVLQFRENHRVVITLSGDARIKILDPAKKPLIPIFSTARRFELRIPQTAYYTIVLLGKGSLEVTVNTSPY